jgi:signal transduction histidine kinase
VFLELHKGRRELLASLAAHEKTTAELEVANAALRHFTDAASHDLKAPLRTVRSFLAALSQELGDSIHDPARDYLERSTRGAERMDRLLDSLLAYARLQRNLARAEIHCDVLFEQIKTDLREDLARANTKLEAESLPAIHGDPDRVYQLFCNLVGNALKFRRSEVPLCVHVSAQRRGDEGLFCVADNGVGIDLEHQARIFQPFFRSETQGKFAGSGLGLAICQQVVEQHGGRIWVESKPDHGSNFYFTLPLA